MKDKAKEDDQTSRFKTEGEKVDSAFFTHHITNIVPSSIRENDVEVDEEAVEAMRFDFSCWQLLIKMDALKARCS